MKEVIRIFNEYAKKYDLRNPNIMMKYHHSFRVMEFSKEIAKSIGMSEDDIELASIIGLYHDIARFRQWSEYETYKDELSFDHGNVGYDILKSELINKITTDKEKQEIIMKAVVNHNKYKIEDGLSDKTLLMSKIVRDADKLDIMTEQINIVDKKYDVDSEVKEIILNHQMLPNTKVNNRMDSLFRHMAFMFDLNFKYSYQYLLDKKIISNMINVIEIYSETDQKDIEDNLITYIKERV